MFVVDDAQSNVSHFKAAAAAALLLHILLALLLPSIPKLILPEFNRGSSLNVFLQTEEEAEEFDQSLNQQLPLPAKIDNVADPSLGSASVEEGEDALVSDEVEPSKSVENASGDKSLEGQTNEGSDTPTIRFDFASIRLFAKNEAFKYAEQNPRKLERFARTFNRARNYRRRSPLEGYQDRLGDILVRSNSSDGDICFKQQREQAPDDFSTNTVYFFRCDRAPLELDLDKTDKG